MFEAKTFAVWVGEAVPVAVPGAPGMMSCVEKYLKLTRGRLNLIVRGPANT